MSALSRTGLPGPQLSLFERRSSGAAPRQARMHAFLAAEADTLPTTSEPAKPARRPPTILRAPPSRRVVSAKEKVAEEMAQAREARWDSQRPQRRWDDNGGGPGGGQAGPNGPPRPPGGPGGYQQRGGPGQNGPGGGGAYQQRPGGPGGYQQRSGPGTGGGPGGAGGGSGPYNRPGPRGPGTGAGPPPQQGFRAQGGPPQRGPGPGGPSPGGRPEAAWRNKSGQGSGGRPTPPEKEKVNIAGRRKSRQSRRQGRQEEAAANAAVREEIFEVGAEGMSVADLSAMLAVTPTEVVKLLFMRGVMVQVNSTLDAGTVKAVAQEFGVEVLDKEEGDAGGTGSSRFLTDSDLEHLVARPPVVAVMGHVDHGKTSLLDYVRKSKVAAGEAGGITQAIGAYTCTVDYSGFTRDVTFLDTPGHEAFSAMRARGAKVTDIAIIIVAADDGVRPQTIEAISHAQAAGVPIVVAINKVDKEGANPERTKQELTEHGLVPEEWGGKTPMVNISAKKGTGVDELLEMVLLVAEIEDLAANPMRAAQGTVLEASLDRRQGPVATLLVQNGTLRVGDAIAAGGTHGRVRSMRSVAGEVGEAGPSIAVQMHGLSSVPTAGDEFAVYATETEARVASENVGATRREERLAEMSGGGSMITLSSLASFDEDEEEGREALQRMNIIIKADASGSCEAVKSALSALPQDSVALRYLLAAPGEVTNSDLDLAIASGGMVLAFNVSPSEAVQATAKQSGVELRTYSVIYNLVDDVRAAMEGRLKSIEERVAIGTAEVKAVFGSGNRRVAGCMVTDGALRKGCLIQILRGKKVMYDGPLASLRRLKDDVKEVAAGTECGVALEAFREWAEGDRIEAFQLVSKKLSLEESQATAVEF